MAHKNQKQHTDKILKGANIDELLLIMNELETEAQTQILEALGSELTDKKKKVVVSRIQQAAIVADGKVKSWIVPAISSSYVAGMQLVDDQLKKFGFKTVLGNITIEVIKTVPEMQPHLAAVNSLLSDAYLDFGSGITGFVRGTEHTLNDALRRQIQSKIALGRLTGTDIRTIKKTITAELGERGFTTLLDRGGKRWQLNRYSEMLARTHIIKANTEATVNRAGDHDIDIVEVSTHGTEDALCLRFEGNIYSLSGRSKKYPVLPQRPPFHPNCKHTLLMRPDLS